MQKQNRVTVVVLAIQLLGVATFSGAADKMAMPADPKAMMAQMQKNAAPGPQHAMFQQAAGHWTYTVKSWMKPGDPPMESKGTSEMSVILGGRFLQQTAKGDMNGQVFDGIGYTGYDTIRGEYESVWMDTLLTGMMVGSGPADATGKMVTQTGTFACPMTNEKARWYRTEWKMIGNDTQSFVMYGKGPDGKEMKAMEMIYQRVK